MATGLTVVFSLPRTRSCDAVVGGWCSARTHQGSSASAAARLPTPRWWRMTAPIQEEQRPAVVHCHQCVDG